jgi:hypothetical protein
MDIGIPQTSLVRLGGKSTSRTEPLSLYNQKKLSRFGRADWSYINERQNRSTLYLQKLRDSFQSSRSKISAQSILEYVEFEDPEYFQAFRVPDSALSGDTFIAGKRGSAVNEYYLLSEWLSGRGPGIFKKEPNVKEAAPIWGMHKDARQEKLATWQAALFREQAEKIYEHGHHYNSTQHELDRKYAESEGMVLRSKRIIGCTTTAAAKYSEHLRDANPGILLVEEAGEILESHVLTALGEETFRMILIGDHQ